MKKIILLLSAVVVSWMAYAQLPYEHTMTKEDFDTPTTVFSQAGEVTWNSIGTSALKGMYMGKLVVIGDAQTHSAVVALPHDGIPDKVFFAYGAIGDASVLTVYESPDHENWTGVWTHQGKALSLTLPRDSSVLKKNTRYLKFEYSGKAYGMFGEIKVTERVSIATSIDEYQFPTAMVDDLAANKNVTVTWTNIVANVTSTDPSFTVNPSTIGQKNLEDQKTTMVITFNHDVAGEHAADIVLSDGKHSATIHVTGTTKKYEQTLYWNQTIGDLMTVQTLQLNAYTNYSLPIEYHSSDSSIAYVNESGQLIPVCAGEVTITAYQPGNYKYEATEKISKSLRILKSDPIVALSVNNLVYGQPLSAATILVDSKISGTTSWYQISKDSILDADKYDLQVLFSPDDSCAYNAIVKHVQLTVDKAVQTITWNQAVTTLKMSDTLALTATLTSGLDVTYAKTNNNVNIEGSKLIGISEGGVLLVAFHLGNKNYLPTTIVMKDFTVAGGVSPITPIYVHDTVYVHDSVYVHDTLYLRDTLYRVDTLYLRDTLYRVDTLYIPVHDTLYIPVHDTIFVEVHDSIYIPVHDTIYQQVHDTIFVEVHDTIYQPVHDTIYIPVHDTVYIEVHDTIYIKPEDPTNIMEAPQTDNQKVDVQKYVRNGMVYIRREDVIYDPEGKKMR